MRGPRFLAWSGLAVLTAAALWLNLPRLSPGMLNWAEPGNVAAALAEGRGFSDPFGGGTGATAWVPPLPVGVEAAVFMVFGVKTLGSGKALLALTVLGLAAAHALLVLSTDRFGAWTRNATSAAFLAYCALAPGGPLRVLSEAWLDILLSSALLWAALEARRTPRGRRAFLLVPVAAAAALDGAGLAVAAGMVCLALAGSRGRGSLPLAAAALGAAALAVGGWTLRNAEALGRFVPLKSNLWFEVNLANVASPDGLPRVETVLRQMPFFNPSEFERYKRLGELSYVATFRAASLAALRADPLHFAANVARRAGLALVFCRREGGGAFSRAPLTPHDAALLSAAGRWISAGEHGGYWTKIDLPAREERAFLRGAGLERPEETIAAWSASRLEYDAEYRGPLGLAAGFMTAGLPVLALLVAALLRGGIPPEPALWAAAIGAGMLLPFVVINHNERHQIPLVAMQAVALGACAGALAQRRAPTP